MSNDTVKINIFLTYHQEDNASRNDMEIYLKILKHQRFIDNWNRREITTGQKWDNEDDIDQNIFSADIVLLLITPAFLNTGYLQGMEMKQALQKKERREAEIFPIVLKDYETHEKNVFPSELTILPNGGQPVYNKKYWYSKDVAFNNVLKVLKVFSKAIRDDKESKIPKPVEWKPNIHAPGGALPAGIANYIERIADRQLKRLLDYASAPMNLIIGGPQSGKSSLLNRFIFEAQQRNQKVIHIDFSKFAYRGNTTSEKDLFLFVLKETHEDLSGESFDVDEVKQSSETKSLIEWAKGKFVKTVATNLKPNQRAFVVIDSIELLYKYAESQEKAEQFIKWLALLRNFQDSAPLNQLTIIAVLGIVSYSAVYNSPLRTQASSIILKSFDITQLAKLMELLELEYRLENRLQKIFILFAGHPHLSHHFIHDLYLGFPFQDVMQNAADLMGPFGAYWKGVKLLLSKLLHFNGYKQELDSIFNVILAETRSNVQRQLLNDLFEPLFRLGLVDQDRKVSCLFIQNAIQREIGQNDTTEPIITSH